MNQHFKKCEQSITNAYSRNYHQTVSPYQRICYLGIVTRLKMHLKENSYARKFQFTNSRFFNNRAWKTFHWAVIKIELPQLNPDISVNYPSHVFYMFKFWYMQKERCYDWYNATTRFFIKIQHAKWNIIRKFISCYSLNHIFLLRILRQY